MEHRLFAKVLFLCAAFAVSACTSDQGETTIPGVFNTPLTLFDSVKTDEQLLFPEGYDLENEEGKGFGIIDCDALAALDRDAVASRDFSHYLYYRADCMGATAYLAGSDATVSFLRNLDIADIVPLLPATVKPELNSRSDPPAEGLTLGKLQQDLSLSAISKNSVTAKFDIFDADYEILGLRDVNEDGIEDMILRLNYAIVEASGRGTHVYFLTRQKADGPFELLANPPSVAKFAQ